MKGRKSIQLSSRFLTYTATTVQVSAERRPSEGVM